MHNILPVLIGTIFLTSCASNGDLILESGSEEYEGRPAAAVAPVVNPGPGRTPHDDRLHADIQRSIQRQLDLERLNDGNEAEVIIEPTLVGPGSHGSGDVDLRVRVSEKTNRRTVLDRTYESSDGRANTLNVAVSELEDDLADRYGR